MHDEELIKKWLSGELSDTEKKEFESSEEFAGINRLLKAVDAFKAPEYNIDSEYKRLSENIHHRNTTIPLFKRIIPVLKIAAILIIAITAGFFSIDYFGSKSINNRWIAELEEVYLPDSSIVSLNTDSKIRFSSRKWEGERNVELVGQAFFKVKEGSSFNVITKQGTVTVIGTEFDVIDRDNYYEVTCYSGLVKVVAGQNSVTLKPGSVFRIVNGKEENYSISEKTQPDWLFGESSFRSVPYGFVINELERQYKVSVDAKNIDLDKLFTGGFVHDNLEIALGSITIPVDLNFEVNGNKVVITFEDK